MAEARLPRAVLLDAYGTLLELDDPVGRLGDALAAAGFPNPPAAVAAAFRAEAAHYRAHQDTGRDPVSLSGLRSACADVFAASLPAPPPAERTLAVLLAGLRYRLFPDVIPILDSLSATGIRLAVVSNWDCSLEEVLAGLGVAHRFDAIVPSATAGARKPDPAHFRAALDSLGVAPAEAVHVGNDFARDCVGARRAGIRAVLLERDARGGSSCDGCIASLTGLPEVLGVHPAPT